MPRELTLGNGSLQVMFDAAYQLRDIYFPYVGQENHTAGHAYYFCSVACRKKFEQSPQKYIN